MFIKTMERKYSSHIYLWEFFVFASLHNKMKPLKEKYKFLAKATRHQMNVFDVDDTLVVTDSKIRVTDHKTGEVVVLTPQEFNEYEAQPHHTQDYSDFQCIEILKAGRIIHWVLDILKNTLEESKAVGIVTARDNSKLMRDFLLHHNIDINPDFIFAVSDPIDYDIIKPIAVRKKQAFKKLVDLGFNSFRFYDDDKENLTLVKSLEKELDINIKTEWVNEDWIPG